MSCCNRFSTTVQIDTRKPLAGLGRGFAVAALGLLGACCGVLVAAYLQRSWDTIDLSELQAIVLPAGWDTFVTIGVVVGALQGIGCALLYARARRPHMSVDANR